MTKLHRPTVWALATVSALLGVFAMYFQPDFLVMLTNLAWSCF